METETGARTRRLILALEMLALITSGLLVLIDYRLKQDLLKLFQRIEVAIETANRIYPQNPDVSSDTGDISGGSVVGDNPSVETSAPDITRAANGSGRKTANRRTSPNGSGGTRSAPVSQPGK